MEQLNRDYRAAHLTHAAGEVGDLIPSTVALAHFHSFFLRFAAENNSVNAMVKVRPIQSARTGLITTTTLGHNLCALRKREFDVVER